MLNNEQYKKNDKSIDIKSLTPDQKRKFVGLIENGQSAHEAYRTILQQTPVNT
jgi:hypothetical protein